MRILVQLVKEASVTIDGTKVAQIGKGFLFFVGFTDGDSQETIRKMADKALKLRIFPDENGKTNLSLASVGGEVLSVSQFTLYGDASEGNRPSFFKSMRPEEATKCFDYFNSCLRETMPNLQTGVFQTDMKVSLINDGPFTLMLDSEELFK